MGHRGSDLEQSLNNVAENDRPDFTCQSPRALSSSYPTQKTKPQVSSYQSHTCTI